MADKKKRKQLTVLEMLDQQEKLCPPPKPQVVEELEELMAISCSR